MRGAREFLRFCVVGGIGFIVDAGILEFLVGQDVAAPMARVVSIAVALQVTFLLHGFYTFARAGFNKKRWVQFMLYNLLGAAVNYGVFLGVLMLAAMQEARADRLVALVAGTAAGLVFNYTTNRIFVFAAEKTK